MKMPTFVTKMQRAKPQMFDDRPPMRWHDPVPTSGMVGSIDIKFAANLPEAAQRIVRDIADELNETTLISHALHGRREEIREAMGNAGARISQLQSPLNTYRNQNGPALDEQRKIIADCRADLDRMDARAAEPNARARVLGQLMEAARDLVRRAPVQERKVEKKGEDGETIESVQSFKQIEAYVGPSPTLRKGETAAEAVENRRRRLRELEADLSRTMVAPKLSADMKAQEIARIEFLAKQGAPNAFATIERGEAIIWPTTTAQVIGQPAGAVVPDFMAIIAHLHRDAMIAAVSHEIDLMADDANALSDADRAKALIQIKRDTLAMEREEVSFVHGREFTRREPVVPTRDRSSRFAWPQRRYAGATP